MLCGVIVSAAIGCEAIRPFAQGIRHHQQSNGQADTENELVPSPPTSPPWGSGPGAVDPASGISPGEPWPGGGAGDEAESRGHSKAWGRNYASIIRRDCMWSGFSARERLERVVSDRLAPGAPRGNPPKAPATPDGTPSLETSNPAPATQCQLGEPKTQACSGSESPSDSGKDHPGLAKREAPLGWPELDLPLFEIRH